MSITPEKMVLNPLESFAICVWLRRTIHEKVVLINIDLYAGAAAVKVEKRLCTMLEDQK
jgi:hypothetical protein